MNTAGLCDLSLTEAARRIQSREVSPVDLTRAYLDRIERLNPAINCYITVTAEAALAQARQAEDELYRGSAGTNRTLHGIPLAIKDLFETAGVRTTAGAKVFEDYIPDSDAPVVERLRAAGCVLLGKANMHEIALGLTNINPHYGVCRNPWALDRVPGGSSGGSAAALAGRMCAGALGSDTGGSIRVPAALCGVVGLKPTFGRVSLRGAIPLSWNLDHAGPMARTVEDVALLLQVIAGYDPDDPYSVDTPVDDYLGGLREGIKGGRVALASGEYFNSSNVEITAAVQRAATLLESLGARVDYYELSDAHTAALTNGRMTTADAAAFHAERLHDRPQDFGEDVRLRLEAGAALPIADYVHARRIQTQMRRRFFRIFTDYDVLLLPTTPVAAPPIEGPDAIELARLLTRYTAPFNLTGFPALSVPCGFTPAGLPVGLQMVSAPWNEAGLLRFAWAYEQAAGWYTHFPEI